jgi:hypothetical protein
MNKGEIEGRSKRKLPVKKIMRKANVMWDMKTG